MSTRALGSVTPFEKLYGTKPDLGRVPEWGQHVWVHTDKGSKLDGHAAEARWVGYDQDSMHAHQVYWPNKHCISVEQNIKFVPVMVTVHSPRLKVPPSLLALPAMPQTQPSMTLSQRATPSLLSTSDKSLTPTATSVPLAPIPTATSSGEEEMPEVEDDDEEAIPTPSALVSRPTIGSQLKQKVPVQPPGVPKKAKGSPVIEEATHQSQHIAE